jgi:hypothetical protein
MNTETLVAILALAFGFLVQLLVVAYLYGRLTERVRSQGEWIERVDRHTNEGFARIHQSIEDVRRELSASLANLNTLVYDMRKDHE